jgi:phage terminase large subunit-like protein
VIDWPTEARLVPFEIKGGNGEIIRGLPRGRAEEGDEWRAVTYVSPDSGAYTQVVAAVDPASGLRGGKYDAIGLAIVGVTQGGRGVIRVAQGVRGNTTQEAIRETARIIVAHGVNTLLVEETAGSLFGQMLCAHLAATG